MIVEIIVILLPIIVITNPVIDDVNHNQSVASPFRTLVQLSNKPEDCIDSVQIHVLFKYIYFILIVMCKNDETKINVI